MARTTITMACGHEEMHRLSGRDADRRAEWLAANHVCAECYAAQQEQEREAERARRDMENAQAAADALKAGLPRLEGTERQVAWAESIRSKRLAAGRVALQMFTSETPPQKLSACGLQLDEVARGWAAMRKAAQAAYDTLAAEQSAHDIIDHRDQDAADIIRDAARTAWQAELAEEIAHMTARIEGERAAEREDARERREREIIKDRQAAREREAQRPIMIAIHLPELGRGNLHLRIDRAESSYGIPVLVDHGQVLDLYDEVPGTSYRAAELVHDVWQAGTIHSSFDDLVRRYLEQVPISV